MSSRLKTLSLTRAVLFFTGGSIHEHCYVWCQGGPHTRICVWPQQQWWVMLKNTRHSCVYLKISFQLLLSSLLRTHCFDWVESAFLKYLKYKCKCALSCYNAIFAHQHIIQKEVKWIGFFFPHCRAYVQHVFPDSWPDWYDWHRPQSNDLDEPPHPLQPCDASHTSLWIHGADEWPHSRWERHKSVRAASFSEAKVGFSTKSSSLLSELWHLTWLSSRSWWRHEGQGRQWRRRRGSRWSPKEPQQHGEPRRRERRRGAWARRTYERQPGQPGPGLSALLPGASDARLHQHEPAVTNESAWALPAWTLPGLLVTLAFIGNKSVS